MKACKEIKKELVKNLRNTLQLLTQEAEDLIQRIEEAETVEEIMYLKSQLLDAWISRMPLTSDHCYFCLYGTAKYGAEFECCDKCEYARQHGVCAEENSDYEAISSAAILLRGLIRTLYYSGEKYDKQETGQVELATGKFDLEKDDWTNDTYERWKKDLKFITEAREALPYWLQRVRELEGDAENYAKNLDYRGTHTSILTRNTTTHEAEK